MKKIICFGSSSKDIIFPITDGSIMETPEDFESQKKIVFELGAKYQSVDGRHESLGGCAANVSCGLSRLGLESFCCTRVGEDASGDWIKSEMKKNKVNIDLVQTGKHTSDLSTIIAHVPTEDRIVFSDRDSNQKLEIILEDIEKVGADWIFVSSLNGNGDEDWVSKLDKIAELAGEGKIKLAFNPGQKNIKVNPAKIIETIRKTDILIINKDEAIEIVDKLNGFDETLLNDEKFLVEKLNELGVQIVALTDGSRGAWGYDGKDFLHVDARKEKVADTLGAGDAFSSGFLAGHIKGNSLEECLRWGIANGASAVRFYGGVEGLLNEQQINS